MAIALPAPGEWPKLVLLPQRSEVLKRNDLMSCFVRILLVDGYGFTSYDPRIVSAHSKQ
jgi:hypothetical protein